ncbi:hypothetical protein NPIL_523371 [Nephila pilipes]|uniref:Uncharacterized protein n=1 Tax=Nephila pilipes TaxID=299642 RepID=A0A8X6QCD6_NEPPI|nr:hypothetical protein NPIL_523371 [Nephila pilipes]
MIEVKVRYIALIKSNGKKLYGQDNDPNCGIASWEGQSIKMPYGFQHHIQLDLNTTLRDSKGPKKVKMKRNSRSVNTQREKKLSN